MFNQKIDKRKKADIIEFLTNHCRYYTMNPWNRTKSYANNIKLYSIDNLPSNAYDILNEDSFGYELEYILNDFEMLYNHYYSIGLNGRNDGYLVLYEQEITKRRIYEFKNNKDRDYSDSHGWLTKNEAIEKGLYRSEITNISLQFGRSLGDEDFECMDIDELKRELELVQDFDRACSAYVDAFKQFCIDHKDVDKEISDTHPTGTLEKMEDF